MIKAEEATKLASDFLKMHGEIIESAQIEYFETQVSSVIEKIARKGKFECIIDSSSKDAARIIDMLQANGYIVTKIPSTLPDSVLTSIRVNWKPAN
jgi:hypothetical protein